MSPVDFFCRSPGFKRHLEELRPSLYKMAYSWCHSGDIADDLVQEAIIKAMRKAGSLRDKKASNSWMFAILFNCWRDHLRRQKPTEDIDDCIFTDDNTPELIQERQDITDIVQMAIAMLPQGQRQVLSLIVLEGFSYIEVSEIMRIPIGTVMSRLNRARKALAVELLDLKKDCALTHCTDIRIVK